MTGSFSSTWSWPLTGRSRFRWGTFTPKILLERMRTACHQNGTVVKFPSSVICSLGGTWPTRCSNPAPGYFTRPSPTAFERRFYSPLVAFARADLLFREPLQIDILGDPDGDF